MSAYAQCIKTLQHTLTRMLEQLSDALPAPQPRQEAIGSEICARCSMDVAAADCSALSDVVSVCVSAPVCVSAALSVDAASANVSTTPKHSEPSVSSPLNIIANVPPSLSVSLLSNSAQTPSLSASSLSSAQAPSPTATCPLRTERVPTVSSTAVRLLRKRGIQCWTSLLTARRSRIGHDLGMREALGRFRRLCGRILSTQLPPSVSRCIAFGVLRAQH